VLERLRRCIPICREKGDAITAVIFERILENEEEHVDYLETQLELMDALGDQLYLASLVDAPGTGEGT
jgi:bacterioferritin